MTGLSEAVADHLADPESMPAAWARNNWWTQSLAHGVPGIALLHIELAATGRRPWQRAHAWLRSAAHTSITGGADSHLFYGAPALAHALACADAARPGVYTGALATLDAAVLAATRKRIDAAHLRLDRGELPDLAEFDVIRGLTGIGSYLLRRGHDDAVRTVLEYLGRLVSPVAVDGETVPGWWTSTGPSGRPDDRFSGGHANAGMAHGIGGPLALLALSARCGITEPGQLDAITTILTWLRHWQTETPVGPSWPYWITYAEHTAHRLPVAGARRPSWCYGTAGLARAHQLAAIAIADDAAQRDAEGALIRALADPGHRAVTTDSSVCHGLAGNAHLALRVASDASPATAVRLSAIAGELLDAVCSQDADPVAVARSMLGADHVRPGFLEGAAGTALAACTDRGRPLVPWDACLLIA